MEPKVQAVDGIETVNKIKENVEMMLRNKVIAVNVSGFIFTVYKCEGISYIHMKSNKFNLGNQAHTQKHTNTIQRKNRPENDRIKVTSSNMASASCAARAPRHYCVKTI